MQQKEAFGRFRIDAKRCFFAGDNTEVGGEWEKVSERFSVSRHNWLKKRRCGEHRKVVDVLEKC